MSGPEHGWPRPLSRGPGSDASRTGPQDWTGSGPGPDLFFFGELMVRCEHKHRNIKKSY